jgi:ElaB/YqjD/DUF883 family membrane-anchored ribosome-binding protein
MEATMQGNTPMANGKDSAGPALTKAAASLHNTVDKMAAAADKAIRKVEPAIEGAAKMAHKAVNKAADVAVPAAGWISERGDRLNATGRKLASDTTGYVSANPWKSLGMALAAGYLVSRLVR